MSLFAFQQLDYIYMSGGTFYFLHQSQQTDYRVIRDFVNNKENIYRV